jgi:DNA-binding transcriptional LysR family regulator
MSGREPSWDHYAALLAVLREGSLSGGARTLGLTQPTVRRQIEQLEEDLGVVLFTRSANGLLPTELARAAQPYAESIAAATRALGRTVSAGPDVVRGTVRVTCSEVLGVEVLPGMLLGLRQAWPELQIEIAATDRTQDLLRRDADVAVRMVEPTQSGLVRKLAGKIEIGLFAHADYAARHPLPRSLSALSDGHFLVGADRGRGLIDYLGGLGLSLGAKHFAVRSDSDVVQLAAVRAGLGIGVCQVPLSARPEPLVRVLPSLVFKLDAWVVMHEDLRQSARVRAVFDALVAGLAAYSAGRGVGNAKRRPRGRP